MTPRLEKILLAVLVAIFIAFTWQSPGAFYNGDDLMNTYAATELSLQKLVLGILLPWQPLYRPLGALMYKAAYDQFHFVPAPLYVFGWVLLISNLCVSYIFFKEVCLTRFESLVALALTFVHGCEQELYMSMGTLYDKFWFLFTVVALTVHVRMRKTLRQRSILSEATIALLCLLAMDSKESGVTLPLLIVAYDLLYWLPRPLTQISLKVFLQRCVWFYSVLASLAFVFVFLRVGRTPDLVSNNAYQPHASIGVWLSNIGHYVALILYKPQDVSAIQVGLAILGMVTLAVVLRNRAMGFGIFFFLLTISPVALIRIRPGYVLYVPAVGLGLYFAALLSNAVSRLVAIRPMVRRSTQFEFTGIAILIICLTIWHSRHWPPAWPIESSREYKLTSQFKHDFPVLPTGAKLLFVKDGYSPETYDILLALRLMYGDKSLVVHRTDALAAQQPDFAKLDNYDHVFLRSDEQFVELDNKDVARSIKLNILKDYEVGRSMIIAHKNYRAYIVSGIIDGNPGDPGRWTTPHLALKFVLFPAPLLFKAKFWVADVVAASKNRTLTVRVGGNVIGTASLSEVGSNAVMFPVNPELVNRAGFTFVDFDVKNAYVDPNGQGYGVVLLEAGFDFPEAHPVRTPIAH